MRLKFLLRKFDQKTTFLIRPKIPKKKTVGTAVDQNVGNFNK